MMDWGSKDQKSHKNLVENTVHSRILLVLTWENLSTLLKKQNTDLQSKADKRKKSDNAKTTMKHLEKANLLDHYHFRTFKN